MTFARSWQKETLEESIRDKVLIMGAFWDYISRSLTGFLFVLILTLPESFPYKGEFQCLAFVAIAAGLILQPLLIQGVLDRSDVSPAADAGEPQQGKR